MRKTGMKKESVSSLLLVSAFLAIASLLGALFFRLQFAETNIVIVYILFVLLSARLTQGYVYGIVSAIASTFAFNYLFTEPYFTFRVDDPNYVVTFFIMTITALITSALTTRFKEAAREAARKEAAMRTLYQLTNHLTDAHELHDVAKITTKAISDIVSARLAFLCFDEAGHPEQTFLQQGPNETFFYREVEDAAQLKYRVEEVRGSYFEGSEFCEWPVYGRSALLGILRIPKALNAQLSASQIHLIHSMLESSALAMGRLMEAKRRIQSNEAMVQERYRGNLLRSISHDLRTPLAGIMGSAEILMDLSQEGDMQYELSSAIYEDANWLRSLVENILNLTKLQDGKLALQRQVEALEDIVGSAIGHFSRRAHEYEISVAFPETIIMVKVDAKLIIQLLINLLDNAMKHSPPHSTIHIVVEEHPATKEVSLCVVDCGEGIAAKDLPHLFQMFYTSHQHIVDAKHGIGLGLTICEAIVHAHGGSIMAQNREDQTGALFRFTLPMEEVVYE